MNNAVGFPNFCKRGDVITFLLDKDGTFTVKVDITIGTEKKKVWYPSLRRPPSDKNNSLSKLYGSTSCTDVTSLVGASRTKFVGHTCIIELRANALYELISTTEEDHDDDCNRNITQLALPDIDESAFETLVLFIYKDVLPTITDNNNNNNNGDDTSTGDGDFGKVKSILCVADRFGCTDLKLYMESMLVDKFILASTAIGLLMLADARSCALLKEACMDAYVNNSPKVTHCWSNC